MGDSVRKIVFIMPELGSGGAERVIFNLIMRLADDNFQIQLTLFKGKGYLVPQLPNKVELKIFQKKRLSSALPQLFQCVLSDTKLIFVSGYHNPLIALIGYVLGRSSKVILRETSVAGYKIKSRLAQALLRTFVPIIYPSCGAIIFQSEFSRRDFEMSYLVKLPNAVVLINPAKGVDTVLGGERKSIFLVGSLNQTKNYTLALRILSRVNIHNYKIEVFGDGPELDQLKGLAEHLNLGPKIIFHGHVQDMNQHWSRARLHILTSLHESLPNAAIEAAIHGVPTVSLDSPGGLRELFKLLPVGACVNEGGLVKAVEELLSTYSIEHALNLSYFANKNFADEAYRKYVAFLEKAFK